MFVKYDRMLFDKCQAFERKYGFGVNQFAGIVQNDHVMDDKNLRDFLIESRKAKEEIDLLQCSGLESEFMELMKELIAHVQKDD